MQFGRPSCSVANYNILCYVERQNFPTDLYMLEGLIRSRGNHHKLVLLDDPRELADGQYDFSGVAAVLLTHVSYCSGRMLDMPAITSAIHKGCAYFCCITVSLNDFQTSADACCCSQAWLWV